MNQKRYQNVIGNARPVGVGISQSPCKQDALAEPIISKTDLQTFVRRTLPDYTGCTLLAQVISEAGSF
jgi:hypothetical protein